MIVTGSRIACLATAVFLFYFISSISGIAQQQSFPADDLPAKFDPPVQHTDFEKRVVMVPMRDGVKLYTVIVVAKGAKGAPIVLTRTPYNAAARAERSKSGRMIEALPLSDEGFVEAGYIRVYQDVRGKYGSEGPYLMTPPPLNSGYDQSGADDTTDAYDTIDWLVKNVPESNGRVGMIGSSYEGFTVVMALLSPHPALKVAAPESPMVDGWMGDDWFHYGAFRQPNIDYVLGQTSKRGEGAKVAHESRDDYTNFLRAGSADAFAQSEGMEQLPYWRVMVEHPTYDGFWQSQALDKLIAQQPLTVPTMWEQGLWDQEDMWGAIHSYRALKKIGTLDSMNHLVMGPWYHSQASTTGTDSDWVVKLIDVQPDRTAPPVELSGYELPIAIDIFRGRYRTNFDHPEAIKSNEPLLYTFGLPMVNHTFLPGHQIMVQVQSTLFPLYDRNPQRFVPNIFKAKREDYEKATQRIWHEPGKSSYITLPGVSSDSDGKQ